MGLSKQSISQDITPTFGAHASYYLHWSTFGLVWIECLVQEHFSDVDDAVLATHRAFAHCRGSLFLQIGTSNLYSYWSANVSMPSSRPRIQWLSPPGAVAFAQANLKQVCKRRGRDGETEWRDFRGRWEGGGRRHTDAEKKKKKRAERCTSEKAHERGMQKERSELLLILLL